jgi:hypothetical protein
MEDEEYQTTGSELYHLAQNLNEAHSTFVESEATQTLRVKSLPQAAVAGLYLTHTLDPLMTTPSRSAPLRVSPGGNVELSPSPLSQHASAGEQAVPA